MALQEIAHNQVLAVRNMNADNLITCSDFNNLEACPSNNDQVYKNWRPYSYDKDRYEGHNISFTIDNLVKHGHQGGSLKIHGVTELSIVMALNPTELQFGSYYRFSFWYKTTSNNVGGVVYQFLKSNALAGYLPPAAEWTFVEKIFFVDEYFKNPDESNSIKPHFYIGARMCTTDESAVWIDDVRIQHLFLFEIIR